jgi:hypothetical protein
MLHAGDFRGAFVSLLNSRRFVMANRIVAINTYRPRLKLGNTVQMAELVEYIADRTGLNTGDLQIALSELSAAVGFFNKRGEGVKIPSLGTYLPKIALDGSLNVSHRLDRKIKNRLNIPGAYIGDILNRDNIGKTPEQLIALWNQDNPTDPVE